MDLKTALIAWAVCVLILAMPVITGHFQPKNGPVSYVAFCALFMALPFVLYWLFLPSGK